MYYGILFFCFIYIKTFDVTIGLIQDLNGIWQWRSRNSDTVYNLPATVPGGIYTDLMKNGLIEDVFYGFNDIETRWVSKMDWSCFTSFNVSSDLLQKDNINLILDGIDTFSTILINNKIMGATENMFVRYIFDIKSHLKVGVNKIEVQFTSAVNKAKALFKEQAENYEIVPLCVPDEYNGECHANHVRKMQASFSWDWGPALPSIGIWKNVYLEAYDHTVLRDITVNIISNPSTSKWDLEINVYLAKNIKANKLEGTFEINIHTDIKEESFLYDNVVVQKNEHGDFLHTFQFSILKPHVKLWWPNGYGKAKLYPLEINYFNNNTNERDKKTLKIGFRTVELVQNALGLGRTFYFKINNVPIFAKGSNSIPISILPELASNKETITFLLQSAKDVHSNMIRVWGGGNYEAEIFYELADEMGIMIWQDFMFACAMYPTNDAFLRTVIDEVKHQVRRLQYHPSIVLWAGSNENEAALRQNWYGTEGNFSLYKRDFIKLYVDTIEKELYINDNTRSYLTSSPTNGLRSKEEGYVAQQPQSNFYGDVHFYNYVNDSWNTSTYPINRFSSEYGYQSLPNIQTLLTATNDPSNLAIGSKFLVSRQHRPLGYQDMEKLINFQLQLPSNTTNNDYKYFIYYSQIIQAMAVKIETEYYRRWRSIVNDAGQGYTMGALYWQLNDVWVAPTWSGIDFKQNWKMMQYYAKHFFAPVIITGELTSSGVLNLYVVSDLTEIISEAFITVSVYKWSSFEVIRNDTFEIIIYPGSSSKIRTYTLPEYLSPLTDDVCGENPFKNCFVYLSMVDATGKMIAPNNFVFLTPLKSATIQTPVLMISKVEEIKETTEYTIEIETSAISLFVWLEAKGIRGRFSDNGFVQITPRKTIQFVAEKPTTLDDLQNSLTISNLMIDFQEPSSSNRNKLAVHFSILVIITFFMSFL